MTVFASAVASQNDHGYEAGRYVATQCLAAFQRPPALLVAFISDQYNSTEEVVRGIRSITNTIPLLGGSTPHVITMAGVMHKRVALLGISSPDLHVGLALQRGDQAEQAVAAAAEHLPDASNSDLLSLVALTNNPAGAALQAASARLASRCAIAEVVGTASRSSVFVNDEVAADALAVGLLRASVPVGVGIRQAAADALPEAAQAAAEQAMAALNGVPAAAALVAVSGSAPTADPVPEVEQVRDTVGRITPLLGAYAAGAFSDVGDTATLQEPSVLVLLVGQS